jgi:hypothetical protein
MFAGRDGRLGAAIYMAGRVKKAARYGSTIIVSECLLGKEKVVISDEKWDKEKMDNEHIDHLFGRRALDSQSGLSDFDEYIFFRPEQIEPQFLVFIEIK